MVKAKKQHYIPRGIIKHFEHDRGKVYELLQSKNVVYSCKTMDTMCENYTYEHPSLDENYFEKSFSKIENEFTPFLDDLIASIEAAYENSILPISLIDKAKEKLPVFLLFYFRSIALLTENSFGEYDQGLIRIERMAERVLDFEYIWELGRTIRDGYKSTLLVDPEERFILSDQYVSTASLSFKCKFSNASNRQIGMKDTIILVPLSSKYYILFYHGSQPSSIKEDSFVVLNTYDRNLYNNVICKNSYVKCISKSKEELTRILSLGFHQKWPTSTIASFEDGSFASSTVKKEVFFYEIDEEIDRDYPRYASYYGEKLSLGIRRNDPCPCDSGLKYKKCCEAKLQRLEDAMRYLNNPDSNYLYIRRDRIIEEQFTEEFSSRDTITNQSVGDVLEKMSELDIKFGNKPR